jgi:hypothetical protein
MIIENEYRNKNESGKYVKPVIIMLLIGFGIVCLKYLLNYMINLLFIFGLLHLFMVLMGIMVDYVQPFFVTLFFHKKNKF